MRNRSKIDRSLGIPHSGFTLIELLVVLATISLLIAILVPALGKARVLARRVACRGQLGQIALGWQLYLDDHDGAFYQEENAEYIYGGWKGIHYTGPPRPLNRYVDLLGRPENETQARVFQCPEDNGSIGFSSYASFGTSYITNIMLIGFHQIRTFGSPELREAVNQRLPGLRLQNANTPARLLLVGDYGWDKQWRPSAKSGISWHGKHCHWNMAFLDGHVSFLQIRKGLFVADEYTVLPFKDLYGLAREVQEEVPCEH